VTTTIQAVETRLVARRSGDPSIEALAREAGLHPDLVRRLLALGALDGYPRDAAPRLARAVRLRADLGLNYAGALLACELLDRIQQLEQRLRSYEASDRRR
jgi:hypothetical protein